MNYPMHRLPLKERTKRNQHIIMLYDQGYAPIWIAPAYGLSYEGVRAVLRKADRMGNGKRERGT